MKIIAFGASYSIDSINREWARYVASRISKDSSEVLDLNDYDLPVYTVERQKKVYLTQLDLLFQS